MEIQELTKMWEDEIKALRGECTSLRLENRKYSHEMYWLRCQVHSLNTEWDDFIHDCHPQYHRLLAAYKSECEKVGEAEANIRQKNAEILYLKNELEKSNNWNTEHLLFLMEAIQKQPLKVIVVSEQEEKR